MLLVAKIVIIAAVCSGFPISDVPCQVPENLRGAYDLYADGQDGGADGLGWLPRRIVVGRDAVTAPAGFRGELSCRREPPPRRPRNRVARDTMLFRLNVEDKVRPVNRSVHPRDLSRDRPSGYNEFPVRDGTHMAFEVPASKPPAATAASHLCLHMFWRGPDSMSYWVANMTGGRPCDTDPETEDYVVDRHPILRLDQLPFDGTTAAPPPRTTAAAAAAAAQPAIPGPYVTTRPHDSLPPFRLFDSMLYRY